MLCPEVWKFAPPDYYSKTERGNLRNHSIKLAKRIENHYFNHYVSVVLPDTGFNTFVDSIKSAVLDDSDYYKVSDFSIENFIKKDFVEGFIKKGKFYAISIGTHIDTHDCIAVTPSGILILSLNKETYQESGLEGKLSLLCNKDHARYVVHIDLKSLTPGKKYYERIKWCLGGHISRKNLIFSWKPHEDTICPSSAAKYINDLGYKVCSVQNKSTSRRDYSVDVPLIGSQEDIEFCSVSELVEWLGAYGIGVNVGQSDEYLSSYVTPEKSEQYGQVTFMQFTGLFLPETIGLLVEELRKYVTSRESLPWVSLYVKGFADSPITWSLQEHQYQTNGDNSYTLFLQPNEDYIIYELSSSRKKPKSH